jgi:hypothetical protein
MKVASLWINWVELSERRKSDMPTPKAECTFLAAPQAISCEVAGETVILDTVSERYFAVDAIGTRIWKALQSPCTLGSLCDRLIDEYDVPAEQCRADISALLDQLSQHGLVTIDQRGPS